MSPYISKTARPGVLRTGADNPGELNYLLTQACVDYIAERHALFGALCYQDINDVLGALDGAAREFYRRVAVPFEDEKRAQNGDVY